MTSPTRLTLGIALAAIGCAAAGLGVAVWNTSARSSGTTSHSPRAAPDVSKSAARLGQESFPDPNAPGTSARVFIDRGTFDQEVFDAALSFTGPIRDAGSLEEVREAVRGRGRRGIAALRDQYDPLHLDSTATVQQRREAIRLEKSIAALYMHEGKFAEAASWLRRSSSPAGEEVPPTSGAEVHVLLGIAALRRGEIENCLDCVGPSSCIFPIAREAVHAQQAGSREAIEQFTAYLEESPGDLRVRWLLNLAYMTLGEYPEKVPPAYLIPLDGFRSKLDVGPVRECRAAGRPGRQGPEPGRRQHLRRFQRRRPARPVHDLDRRRLGGLAVHQPRRRHVRGPVRRGRPRASRSMPSTSPAPISTTTATPTSCCSAAPGRTRPGSRCCGTRATASSRT